MTRGVWRAWLVLSRGSNLPTIVTNVLAAAASAGVQDLADRRVAAVVLAMSGVYVAGMFLNDVCDADHDRRARVRRPIPSGTITLIQAGSAAVVLAVAALAIVVSVSVGPAGPISALCLIAAVVAYDVHHKANVWAPVVMGACRGLVYLTTSLALTGAAPLPVIAGAVLMTTYVAVVTAGARRPASTRPNVPWLLAGICAVDGAVLAVSGAPMAAALAVCAVGVTRLLQQIVPGD